MKFQNKNSNSNVFNHQHHPSASHQWRGKVAAQPPSPDPKESKKKNAKWTPGDDEQMLNELLAAKKAGEMTENGFKKKTYAAVAKKLEVIHLVGGPKTWTSCKTRAKMVRQVQTNSNWSTTDRDLDGVLAEVIFHHNTGCYRWNYGNRYRRITGTPIPAQMYFRFAPPCSTLFSLQRQGFFIARVML